MNKRMKRFVAYGIPLVMIIKSIMSDGSMLDVGLLLIGISWLGLGFKLRYEPGRCGLDPSERANIAYKSSGVLW